MRKQNCYKYDNTLPIIPIQILTSLLVTQYSALKNILHMIIFSKGPNVSKLCKNLKKINIFDTPIFVKFILECRSI